MSGTSFGAHVPGIQLDEQGLRVALRRACLQPGETYVELGSGEGRGLVLAAREFGARPVGVEYLPEAVASARRRAQRAGVDVELHEGDLLSFDAAVADVMFLHLGPAFHDLLATRLEGQLGPHTRVVTWGWEVPGWFMLPEDEDQDPEWPCWLYRPGDPRSHSRWHGDALARTLPPGTTAVDALGVSAGIDLEELELRLDGEVRDVVSVSSGADRLARGQQSLVELQWRAPSPGIWAGSISLWARSRSGRRTRRGPSHPLVLRAE